MFLNFQHKFLIKSEYLQTTLETFNSADIYLQNSYSNIVQVIFQQSVYVPKCFWMNHSQ